MQPSPGEPGDGGGSGANRSTVGGMEESPPSGPGVVALPAGSRGVLVLSGIAGFAGDGGWAGGAGFAGDAGFVAGVVVGVPDFEGGVAALPGGNLGASGRVLIVLPGAFSGPGLGFVGVLVTSSGGKFPSVITGSLEL